MCDERGRPIALHLDKGPAGDTSAAYAMLPTLPPDITTLIGDRGYDSDALRTAIRRNGIEPCIPPRRHRRRPATYCKATYKRRNMVERMFAKLKDWRRIATRYDRCADIFQGAVTVAAITLFWINES